MCVYHHAKGSLLARLALPQIKAGLGSKNQCIDKDLSNELSDKKASFVAVSTLTEAYQAYP